MRADSIYDFVIHQLEGSKGTWPRIAKQTGLSLRTIEKIARKETIDPGVSKIELLAQYFRANKVRKQKSAA